VLLAEHIYKSYPTPSGPLVVLEDVNLTLEPGQSVAIMGPSGSGKSTLLNILGALDRPTSGRVILDGQDYALLGDNQLARLRNQHLGFLFQDHHLLPQCTVLENVLIPLLAFGRPSRADVARAKALLQRVGLAERIDYFPGELSGGERQRVALVRALIGRPKLLLADEPTGNLDAENAAQVIELMLELQKEFGSILVVVTHSPYVAEKMQYVLELIKRTLVRRPMRQEASLDSNVHP
jgi:lipoprotein-releasing system ATP-binding protein